MTEAALEPAVTEEERPVPAATALGGVLATAAFGWLAGSVFEGQLARVLALVAAVLGCAVSALSLRSRRPAVVQYVGAAASVALGVALLLPYAAGPGSVVRLVLDAVRGGGLGEPPVAFDPGWRLLLVVSVALLGEAATGAALALRRPRLAPAAVLPLVVGAALLAPPAREVSATVVALLLLAGSLVIGAGADLAREGATSTGFEVRRVLRGGVAMILLGAALLGTAQLGILFPAAARADVVPPMRPPAAPASDDRVLFTVRADRPLPWRLGTLDVYRPPAWLTPPFDPARLVALERDGTVPRSAEGETRGTVTSGPSVRATFTLRELPGKALPALADPVAVRDGPASTYDPRTQSIRLAGSRARPGTSYVVVAPAPPAAATLARAGAPQDEVREFLTVPDAPPEVQALLDRAPTDSLFARLQYVRRVFYSSVVAAGAGSPVDVPPSRVVQMLAGREASPYEITAGEVLLARWCGVPARIGYGYYGGERTATPGTLAVRPRHGATWLEAHFAGAGWVPIVGIPPRAKGSLRSGQKNSDPSVRPTDELALVVYVPVRLSSAKQLYVEARYWSLVALPVLVAAGLALLLYPWPVKVLRRALRQRAARRRGSVAQVAASYAELRDLATDLRIGNTALSPLELVAVITPDEQHTELAWLVTRCLWGDLRRDASADEARTAEELAASVGRRLRGAQPGLARLAALSSRASLRTPWTAELPTAWPRRRLSRPLAALAGVSLLSAVGALLVVPGLSPRPSVPPRPLPAQLAPPAIGDVELRLEPRATQAFTAARRTSLAAEGRVLTVRQHAVVQGSLQVATLVAGVDTRSRKVRDAVLGSLGAGRFRPVRIGDERAFRLALPEQTLLLSFTPDGHGYYLLVARNAFADAERVFASVLAFSRGERVRELVPAGIPVPDPRRGSPT